MTAQIQAVYGNDINLQPSSPDAQLLNIFIQAVLDVQDLILQVNAMFDPDQAVGAILDQRVAINGIQRQAGTFTITNITIVTSQALTLYGLDQNVQPVYTVQDNAGNQWNLINSVVESGPGTYVLAFQAATPGAVLSVPNTITVQSTIVLGVTSVNNPTTYTTLGFNEESDQALKIRRQQSVALSSQGYLAGLLAALLNITGMASAYVYENTTATTDGNGVPGHSIWVITSGTAASSAIANAIYNKRNAGCGMKGSTSFLISQPDGTLFKVLWDIVSFQSLFIQFTASSLNGTALPNYAAIIAGLTSGFSPSVAQAVNTNQLIAKVNSIDPNTLVSSAGFGSTSTGVFVSNLATSGKNYQWQVSSPNIIILPILLTPTSAAVVHGGSSQVYTSIGGYGTYTYSLKTNASGGSIGSVTGVYTTGSSASVVDVVKVIDSLSNTASVSVSVT